MAKISGLYGGWQGGWPDWKFEHQTETMDFVMEKFPRDRVLVGSDWPVCEGACPGSHAAFLQALKAHVVAKRGVSYAKGAPARTSGAAQRAVPSDCCRVI